MKQLRQYIRQMLLAEAAFGPADLPDDIFIKQKADKDFAEFEFVKKVGESVKYGPRYERVVEHEDGIYGAIQLYLVDEDQVGPCKGAYMISWAGATDGYGPLLYDLAMEWATFNGTGLIADRGSVSPEALAVWEYYLNNRNDVEAVQLDDLENTRTEPTNDNCDQDIARSTITGLHTFWWDSPLSKMYRKTNFSTINNLTARGKLVE